MLVFVFSSGGGAEAPLCKETVDDDVPQPVDYFDSLVPGHSGDGSSSAREDTNPAFKLCFLYRNV